MGAQMWGKQRIIVRRYPSERQYQGDAQRWARRGYRVVSVTSEAPRAGCMRLLTLGIFAMIFRPKPVLVVTYQLGA